MLVEPGPLLRLCLDAIHADSDGDIVTEDDNEDDVGSVDMEEKKADLALSLDVWGWEICSRTIGMLTILEGLAVVVEGLVVLEGPGFGDVPVVVMLGFKLLKEKSFDETLSLPYLMDPL